ncbi:MAG: nucleoid-structuring protein H-NS [Mycobacteriaceae bacterium]|nr:nucleoid-structuring protein H-NS [Mycobacteriaceae bacterium]
MPEPQDRSNTEPEAASGNHTPPESPQLSTPPAKKAPAKKAPVKKAPAKKTLAKKAPAKTAEPIDPQLVDAAKDVAAQAKTAVEIAKNPVAADPTPASRNRFVVPLALSTAIGGLAILLIRKLRCRRCGTAQR